MPDVLPILLDNCAAVLWYEAGAVIPWEQAEPVVQDRYRAKARAALAMGDEEASWDSGPLASIDSRDGE